MSTDPKHGPEVFVRVSGLRGLSTEVLRNFPKGSVCISSELGQIRASTAYSPIGESGKVNEIAWNAADGLIKWSISTEEMAHLKAYQPKLKLSVLILPQQGGREGSNYGYVILDMRDLTREIVPQWFKIHGMNGAELHVSAKLNALLHTKQTPTHSESPKPCILGAFPSADVGLVSVAASTDSARSVLRLALSERQGSSSSSCSTTTTGGFVAGLSGTKVRFSLAVSIEDFVSLSSLCKVAVDEDRLTASQLTYPLPARTFWLSWTLFERDFYTDEFSMTDDGPTRVRDTLRVECPLITLTEHLASSNPLRIYLVSQDMVLASADVPLPALTLDVVESDEVGMSQSGWALFTTNVGSRSPYSNSCPVNSSPAVKVGVQLSIEGIVQAVCDSTTLAKATHAATTQCHDDDDGELKDESVDPSEVDGQGLAASRAVRFQIETAPAPVSPSLRPLETMELSGVPHPASQLNLHEEIEEGAYDPIADEQLRHFRLSIEVPTVSGFPRPAHLTLSFAYPYLGSNAPVRSRPMWVLANTESRIDGAAASYECCLTRENLRETVHLHPLRIQAHSKSQMGNTTAGEVVVDLTATLRSPPHSFRCPVSHRNFANRRDYTKHRHTLIALRSAGRIPAAPPVDPVVVRICDSYQFFVHTSGPGSSSDGSKARVVVIIEDMGLVGNEKDIGVHYGYKSHGAGVYVSEGHDTSVIGGDGDTIIPSPGIDPLLRTDLSSDELARLKLLQLEWETWRRSAEAAWRESLREKETQLRKRLEAETNGALANRADDLRRAHEEAGRLEVRLRGAIDATERQRSQLSIKEESMLMKLAQKTAELQLLQKRVRDEAKIRIDMESRRADSLQQQLAAQQDIYERTEKRARDAEKEYEVSFRLIRGQQR